MNTNPIWNKEACYEALDEALLKTALSSLSEMEGHKLLEENERLKAIPELQLSDSLDKRIQRAFDKQERKRKLHVVRSYAAKIVSKAAVIFLAVSIAFYTTLAVSADFRRVIYDLLLSFDERYAQITRSDQHYELFYNADIYRTLEHAYAPMYLPVGYEVNYFDRENTDFVVLYQNSDDYIYFFQSAVTDSSILRVDTENAESVDTIILGESRALVVRKSGEVTINWQIGSTVLSLASNGDPDELMKMADNIRLLK